MSARPPGGIARGYAVGFALLRLDVKAIARFDGSIDEARESVRVVLASVPLVLVTTLLFGDLDPATFLRLPVLAIQLSSITVGWLAMPVLVSILAPSAGRADRVPLFITMYDYYYAVTVLIYLVAGMLIAVSGSGAILWLVLLNGFWFWSFAISAFAFRAVLQTGWQPAIALTIADFLVTYAVSDWADALVGTVIQS